MAGGREKNALCFGGLRGGANVHLETKAGEVGEDEICANFKFPSGLKSKCSIIHVKHAEDLEEGSVGECFCGVASYSSGGVG